MKRCSIALPPSPPGTAVKKKTKKPNKQSRIVATIYRLDQTLYNGTGICTSSELFNDPTTAALPQQLQPQQEQAFARKSRPLPGLITNNYTFYEQRSAKPHHNFPKRHHIGLRGRCGTQRAPGEEA